MNRVVTVVQIHHCHRVIARCKREILVHVISGIPAEFDAIVPNLDLTHRHGFIGVGDNVDGGHADGLVRRG